MALAWPRSSWTWRRWTSKRSAKSRWRWARPPRGGLSSSFTTRQYLNALCALKFIMEKEYTAAERDAAAVGGQQKPHTIAQAIVQLEHCRDLAHESDRAAVAGAAGAGGAPCAARVVRVSPADTAPPRAAPAPATATAAAAAAAAALQARIAAAIEEEHIAAAKAAAKRTELVALHRELQLNAAQAASAAALPMPRRTLSTLPASGKRPREDHACLNELI